MNKKIVRIYLCVLVILALSLACRLPASTSQTPMPKITVSEEEASNVQATLQAPIQAASPISITLTESQLTSWIIKQLEVNPDQILTNPQVYLRDGIVQLNGEVDQGWISGDVEIKFQIILDDAGKPKINLVSATIGTIPIPSSLLDPMIASIDLDNLLKSSGSNFKIQSIVIADGKITVSGQSQ